MKSLVLCLAATAGLTLAAPNAKAAAVDIKIKDLVNCVKENGQQCELWQQVKERMKEVVACIKQDGDECEIKNELRKLRRLNTKAARAIVRARLDRQRNRHQANRRGTADQQVIRCVKTTLQDGKKLSDCPLYQQTLDDLDKVKKCIDDKGDECTLRDQLADLRATVRKAKIVANRFRIKKIKKRDRRLNGDNND